MRATLPEYARKQLLETLIKLELPDGHRAEIIGGSIIVSPTPVPFHNFIHSELQDLLSPIARRLDCRVANTTTVHLAATNDYFIPDLIVAPMAAMLERTDWIMPADALLLSAEITSPSSARHDRKTKLWSSAHAMIPIYLLVDPLDGNGTASVWSEPMGDGRYATHHTVEFGGKLRIPEPFGIDLDTTAFVRS